MYIIDAFEFSSSASSKPCCAVAALAMPIRCRNEVLSDVARALIESDVSVKLVMTLRDNVKQKVERLIDDDDDDTDAKKEQRASNVSKLVQKTVVDELVQLLEPSRKPHTMKRGKPNVLLFVGLQGAGKTTTIAKYANYYQRRGWKTVSNKFSLYIIHRNKQTIFSCTEYNRLICICGWDSLWSVLIHFELELSIN